MFACDAMLYNFCQWVFVQTKKPCQNGGSLPVLTTQITLNEKQLPKPAIIILFFWANEDEDSFRGPASSVVLKTIKTIWELSFLLHFFVVVHWWTSQQDFKQLVEKRVCFSINFT